MSDMTYELAKELKDAGFPQTGDGMFCGDVGFIKPEDISSGGVVGIAQGDFAYLPTLSELIEACGEQFHMVEQNHYKTSEWGACSSDGSTYTMGTTPDIAVARLWLALQKK